MGRIDWIQAIRSQDKRSIGRLITHIENENSHIQPIIEQLYPLTGRAFVVGITGPPGVGKSTLVDGLITHLRSLDLTVAVIAIDPSSPFTGGAILGDRVRMTHHALDPGVFIRSMGTRGKQGGMAHHTMEVIHVLDAAGYDLILVETVGVGQAELDIMNFVDSVAVVLHPESGDMVQVLKAGIMEISDLFVLNKADLPGVNRMETQIQDMIHLVKNANDWQPPILKLIAKDQQGMDALWEGLQRHQAFTKANGDWLKRRSNGFQQEVREILLAQIHKQVDRLMQQRECTEECKQLVDRTVSPYKIAQKWAERLFS